ncbi:hypothetical protein OIU84_025538 [Salix udensis]|uniref:Uncharacterized protein n=1 Tax=Salix udensis TaxID=889485 RepID=A0AAD6PDR0_9ROSI|nr:hypothetical protein OIU84_025538 [Salix udensis]
MLFQVSKCPTGVVTACLSIMPARLLVLKLDCEKMNSINVMGFIILIFTTLLIFVN